MVMQRVGLARFVLTACMAALMLIPANGIAREAGKVVEEESAAADKTTDSQKSHVVYYFHGDRRCKTCRTIEAYAEEVVKSQFAGELEAGKMAWKAVNYDEPANRHFIKDFNLVSASLVVAEVKEGKPVRFEILQEAWTQVHDKWRFDHYVQRSVRDFMDKSG